MAIYIEITKHYETHEKVAYLYSCDHISWGEFLITKESFALESVKELEGEKQKFYMFRAWGKVRRAYLTTGEFPWKHVTPLKVRIIFSCIYHFGITPAPHGNGGSH